MQAFTLLFESLDATTRTTGKLAALERYFAEARAEDAAWALFFLSGRRCKRLIKTAVLRACAAEAAGLPLWLIEECYETVGDLAETLALVVPEPERPADPLPLHRVVQEQILPLAAMDESAARAAVRSAWAGYSSRQRLVWNKLLTGAFRVGVSRPLLARALASLAGVERPVMDHRLAGSWEPSAAHFRRLLRPSADAAAEPAQPYPFCLAAPLESPPETLGEISQWFCEWKWDGIRAQLLRRQGESVLWSRGEEIITGAFPEVARAAAALPDGTVLDGELLAWGSGAPLPFAELQRRLNRKAPSPALQRRLPVVFVAFDLLESGGIDRRGETLTARRELLDTALAAAAAQPVASSPGRHWEQGQLFGESWPRPETAPAFPLLVSPALPADCWDAVAALRRSAPEHRAEGLMLKLRSSAYGSGRQRGRWWKWKVDPFSADMVLAAQPGHGRRATLFTDYTFAVWQGETLVPVAKAYSGLTDTEIAEVDAFVRRHATGRFGPVRSVEPSLVFEIAFEGIALSGPHRFGLALRFPRIARRRPDKTPGEADTLESLRSLLPASGLAD